MNRGKAEVDGTVRANKFHRSCRGIGDGMQAKGTRRNTGSPSGDCRCDQPATRESQAGPCGVAERPVVPMKPGNAGGGKGPQLKGNARSDEDGGIGDEPSNPSKCSEVADGVARQSEGIARLSFLRAVRQGVPEGCPGIRLRMLQSQWRSSRSRRPNVRGHRGVWSESDGWTNWRKS